MNPKSTPLAFIIILITSILILLTANCKPLREFSTWKEYSGSNNYTYSIPHYDPAKKNIVVIADNEGTEIFDLLAPFYLFNSTEKANVFIVSEKKYPIVVRKGLFILPYFTFKSIDSLNIKADVIVIPNLSAMNAKGVNSKIVQWIVANHEPSIKILSICDGALTAAATGLYDGKPLTTHASDYQHLKKQFPDPHWIKNQSVTWSENKILYSTAGVSNATEGSLVVINDLFGREIMDKVIAEINYPYSIPKVNHNSVSISWGNKISILKKIVPK
ncbi:hypothetical protein BH23BAC1_BH23BAC1_43460 [soil metagenome]